MKKLSLSIFALLLLFALTACGSQTTSNKSSADTTKKTTSKKSAPHKKKKPTLPTIDKTTKKMTISTIKQDSLVQEAAISVKKDEIDLTLIVNPAINTKTAHQDGENFARMLASNSQVGKSPGKNYLGGLWDKYNLKITIGTPSNKVIAVGTKYPGTNLIAWG